jgi:hypothetical protein
MNRKLLLLSVLFLILAGSVLSQNGKALYSASEFKYATVNNININGFTGLTLEAWVNLNQYMPTGSANGNAIFTKEATYKVPHVNYGFVMVVLNELNYLGHNRRLAFGLNFGPNGETHIGLHSDHEIALHEWHHIAGTWDGTYMRVYIDGVLDGTVDVSALGPVYDPVSLLHFAVRLYGVSYLVHYGAIDDARIWNYARSESEIRNAMYQNLTGTEPGLYVYYKFDETSGQTVVDSGPNGLNGYLGETPSNDYWDATRIISTAPMPYYTIQNGDWNNTSTWAVGQLAPNKDWARTTIKHNVSITSDGHVKDLTIDPVGSVSIDPGINLTIDGSMINNAGNSGMVIQSDISGTASLIESTGNINGTVERYLTQNKWHLLGIPVASCVANVFYFPDGSDIYLKTHIESTNTWDVSITDVNTPLILGRGYECWVDDNVNQDELIQFTGIINSGDYTTGINDFYDLQYTTGHGLNLISNPFPSSLQANIQSWSKSNVANKVWVWSPADGNYLFWNGIDGTNGDGYGPLTGGIIPSMQAFFVEATGTNPQLTLPQSSRTHSSQPFYKELEIPENTLLFEINGNSYQDAMYINFNASATEGYDSDFDVEKINGLLEAPQLFCQIPGKNLSINSLSGWDESRSISIGFECMIVSGFTLNVSGLEGFNSETEFYLEDKKEHIILDLKTNPVYTFSGGGVNDPSRFVLHFGKPNYVAENTGTIISVYAEGRTINVLNPNHEQLNLFVYDMMGRQVIQKSIPSEGLTQVNDMNETGYYLVKVQSNDRAITKKIFIR